jgi:hypothetical protein
MAQLCSIYRAAVSQTRDHFSVLTFQLVVIGLHDLAEGVVSIKLPFLRH